MLEALVGIATWIVPRAFQGGDFFVDVLVEPREYELGSRFWLRLGFAGLVLPRHA